MYILCGACQMSLVEPSALLSDTPVPPKIYNTLARFLIISLGVPIPGVIRWMWGNQIQFSYLKQVVLAVSIVSLGRHTPQVLSSFVLPTLQCAACACMHALEFTNCTILVSSKKQCLLSYHQRAVTIKSSALCGSSSCSR